jgi:hypothetical protein
MPGLSTSYPGFAWSAGPRATPGHQNLTGLDCLSLDCLSSVGPPLVPVPVYPSPVYPSPVPGADG